MHQIDRNSYEPAYLQLANILRQQILEGVYRPGDQLPSEAQLCRLYAISPMTVRRSINLLSEQGVVSTAQGRGTFVKALELSTACFDLQEMQNLFYLGAESEIQLLDARVVPADEHTAQKLELKPGASSIYIRRLYKQGDIPIFYHRAYLIYDPTRPIVEAEMDVTSLHGIFAGGNSSLLKCGQLSIAATLMTEEEACLLDKKLPAAAFNLEHIFYDFKDQPFNWGWLIIPAERLHLTTKVGIDG